MKKQLINYPCALPLIGLAGAAGSGKNTVADIISEHFDVVQYAFAAPLKQMLQQGLRLNRHDTDGYRKEQPHPRYGKSPRQMLQTLGTEWGRQMIHPDIWVMATADYCEALHAENPQLTIVLTDVRFENEADFIRKNGGVMIHIKRPDAAPVAEHSSETPVQYIEGQDYVIHNNSDLDWLHSEALDVVHDIASLSIGHRHAP